MPLPRSQPDHLPEPIPMSFGDHLDELRRRLIYALLTVLPIFVLSMVFGEQLLEFILAPARAQLRAANLPGSFIVTNPLEALSAWIKVAFVITIVIGIPAILLQLWLFVSPGLYPHERRFALFLIPMSLVLSVVGLAFLYYVMLPAMLAFLVNFGAGVGQPRTPQMALPPGVAPLIIPSIPGDMTEPPPGALWFNSQLAQLRINAAPEGQKPTILGMQMMRDAGISQQYRVSEYVSLVFTMSLAFAVGFQTPVVVLLLGWMGIVDRAMPGRKRKHAFFIAFVVAAILTPSPDPFSMTLLALPLYFLYELGLILLRFVPASRVAEGFRGRRGRPGGEPPDAGDE